MVRHNNQLPTNLPQLQNLLKRDPASYKDEVQLSTTILYFGLPFSLQNMHKITTVCIRSLCNSIVITIQQGWSLK